MKIERQQDGLYFIFDAIEWRIGAAYKIIDWVKSQEKIFWEWNPDEKRWWIGERLIEEFYKKKIRLIDAVLHPNQLNMF